MTQEALQQIDALQMSYIAALDSKDMHGWLDTFASDGSYVCIANENEESGLPLALMMDDCHERLEDRVTYVTKVWAGTFEDYQTRHFVQRVSCTPKGGDLYETVSNFTVFYTDSAGNTGTLVCGRYVDEIVVNGSGAKLKSRRAVMDTNVAPRYIVYPI
jgi:3-phenylpropionate/cinnamic acid dioxygenase small subunit